VRVTGARAAAAGVGEGAVEGTVGKVGGVSGVVAPGVVAAGVVAVSSATALAMPIEATRPNIVATPRPALAILDPAAA
jgi:hypothetical protein